MKPRALIPTSPRPTSMVPSSARSHSSAAPANSSDNSSEGAIQTSQGTGEAVIAALRGVIAQLENSCEAVAFLNLHAADDAGESSEGADLRAQIDALQAELGDASELIEALQSQNDHLESERARADETNQMLENELSETQTQFAELEGLGLQTENLLQQFGLICDLQTADLWGQIVESACAVVGAEIGVLTDASAMDAVAMRGLGELSPRVAYELFEFTQSVRAQDAIIVENEAAKTPASCGFSNLIALPLAPGHPNGGVLLLANKDTGEFGAPDEFLLSLLQNQIVVALENARWKQQREELHVDTIAVLADAIETKDAENRGHCQSVMQLALDVARRMDIEGAALDEVRRAALLHDIGKVGVPDSILLNTGRLSDDEQTVMRAHAALGSDLVNDVPALQKLAPAILHHHEKWDGSGYPAGLAAENIPVAARIIGAVDAFDAMTTPRLYRSAISAQEALDEMKRCAGTQFDPQIVEILDKLLQEGQKTQQHSAARIEDAAKSARPRPNALKRSQEQSNYLIQVIEQEELEQEEREQIEKSAA